MNARLALAQTVAALTPASAEVAEIGGLAIVSTAGIVTLVVRKGDDAQSLLVTGVVGGWEREVRYDALGDLRSAARKIVFGG